ncbi:MAG: hypothetical protein MJ215_02000 [Spirochaetia bacterium]|nr:hypothetical protein [Spirochaetia bacterium]
MEMVFSLHTKEFGTRPEVVVQGPGSIMLMGNFLDRECGLFLSACINHGVEMSFSRRDDGYLHFFFVKNSEHRHILLAGNKFRKEDRLGNAVKGIFPWLEGMKVHVPGMNITVAYDIISHSGIPISHTIACCAVAGVNKMLDLNLTVPQMVDAVCYSEMKFQQTERFPVNAYGILSSRSGSLTYSDFVSSESENLPLNDDDIIIVVTTSNIPHFIFETDGYNKKRDAYRALASLGIGKLQSLMELSGSEIRHMLMTLPESLRKLCIYMVEEIRRVIDGRELLRKGYYAEFGKLMNRSHESMRDNFNVSCPEVNWLVKRAQEIDGVYGSKLTGAGDTGCTVTLMKRSALDKYKKRLAEYEHIFGFRAKAYVSCPEKGVSVVYSTK